MKIFIFLFSYLVIAAEYSDGTSYIYWNDSIPPNGILGVVSHFNYGGDQLYSNPTWRAFYSARNLATVLLPNQDTISSLSVLNNILSFAAQQSNHSELAEAWMPYVFTGISRGGTLGALNLGWQAGGNKTIAVIAFHGNSLLNIGSYFPDFSQAHDASVSIPVLYKIDQLDSLPSRQTDIESAVRQYYFRSNGCPWTTSMDYNCGHASTCGDTYTLQWLGRVIDSRFDVNKKGLLSTAAVMTKGTIGMYYDMIDGASSLCHFANSRTATYKQFDDAPSQMIWLPPGGVQEWLDENIIPTTPLITSPATCQPSLSNCTNLSITAVDPFGESLSYHWTVVSQSNGGNVRFQSSSSSSTAVQLSCGVTNCSFVLMVTVQNSPALISVNSTVSLTFSQTFYSSSSATSTRSNTGSKFTTVSSSSMSSIPVNSTTNLVTSSSTSSITVKSTASLVTSSSISSTPVSTSSTSSIPVTSSSTSSIPVKSTANVFNSTLSTSQVITASFTSTIPSDSSNVNSITNSFTQVPSLTPVSDTFSSIQMISSTQETKISVISSTLTALPTTDSSDLQNSASLSLVTSRVTGMCGLNSSNDTEISTSCQMILVITQEHTISVLTSISSSVLQTLASGVPQNSSSFTSMTISLKDKPYPTSGNGIDGSTSSPTSSSSKATSLSNMIIIIVLSHIILLV